MGRIARLCIATIVVVTVTGAHAQAQTHSQAAIELPVVIHAAKGVEFDPVALLADAQRYFAGAGLRFHLQETRSLPDDLAELRRIRDRRGLKRYLAPHAINVFVHSAIHDRTPSRSTRRAATRAGIALSGRLGGAHIPAAGRQPGTYIILRASTRGLTLAHELGHFLGVAHHRESDNVMSYGPRRTRFNDRQLRVFRATARRLLRTRALRPQSLPGRTNSRARSSAELPASEMFWTKRASGSVDSR